MCYHPKYDPHLTPPEIPQIRGVGYPPGGPPWVTEHVRFRAKYIGKPVLTCNGAHIPPWGTPPKGVILDLLFDPLGDPLFDMLHHP